jgi:mannose-6-phosphate isomerase-like protein (cupin superfamily)
MSDVCAILGNEGTLMSYEEAGGTGLIYTVSVGNTCRNLMVADADIGYGSLVEIATSAHGCVKTAGTDSESFVGVMYLQHDLDWNVDPVPVGSEAWIVTEGTAVVHVATESEIVTGDLLWSVGDGMAGKAGTITTLSDYRRIVGRVLRGYDSNNIGAYMPVMLGK